MGSATSISSPPPSSSLAYSSAEEDSRREVNYVPPRHNLKFPNEILEKILLFMSSRDKLVAREVCLDWMFHINSAGGVQHLMNIKVSSDELDYLVNSPFEPVFTRFSFHKIDLTRPSMSFWSLYSEYITHLEFFECSVIPRNTTDSDQTDFIMGCPNLKHLSLVNCDKYFLMGGKFIQLQEILCLENLTSLNLSKNKNLTDSILFSILLKIKALKSLDLSDCVNMVYMKAVHNRFYRAKDLDSGAIYPTYSDNVLSFHTLCEDFLLTDRARYMKQFNFGMKLNSTGMQLLLTADINWEIANLESPELKISDLNMFIRKCRNSLLKLELGRCKLSSEDLFAADLHLLEEFTAYDSRNVTNLKFIQAMPHIRKLVLDGTFNLDLSSEDMKGLRNLSVLSLNGIRPIGRVEDFRIELVKCFRKLYLKSLDIGNCPNIVNDDVVQEIIVQFKHLRFLNLEAAPISDAGLTGRPNCYSDNIQRPNYKSTIIQDFINSGSQENSHNLSELKDLEHLNLSHCKNVSDLTWQTALRLPGLITLNLSFCSTLSKRGILSIICNCRNIENLILVQCPLQILSDSEVVNAARDILYRCKAITY